MANISFALTTDQFLAGTKTVTRRCWAASHAMRWIGWYIDDPHRIHTAWDKVPFAGGKRIGYFRLTCAPYLERLRDMPVSDLVAEGGMCKTVPEFAAFIGKTLDDEVTVIRFERVDHA